MEVHAETYCVNCGWRKIEPWVSTWSDRIGGEPISSRSHWFRGTSEERAKRRKAYKAVYMKAYRQLAKGVTS